jgi:hypothetical protein
MQIGAEIRVTSLVNTEVFRNHQFVHEPEIQSADAIGMSMKICRGHKEIKNNVLQKKKNRRLIRNPATEQGSMIR